MIRNKNIRANSSASYAINCQFVLAMMQVGAGSSEAGLLLIFLDLPHSSTFQKTTFSKVQMAMRPSINELSEKQ